MLEGLVSPAMGNGSMGKRLRGGDRSSGMALDLLGELISIMK